MCNTAAMMCCLACYVTMACSGGKSIRQQRLFSFQNTEDFARDCEKDWLRNCARDSSRDLAKGLAERLGGGPGREARGRESESKEEGGERAGVQKIRIKMGNGGQGLKSLEG